MSLAVYPLQARWSSHLVARCVVLLLLVARVRLGKCRGEGSAGACGRVAVLANAKVKAACGQVFVVANAVVKAPRVLVVRLLSWQMLR